MINNITTDPFFGIVLTISVFLIAKKVRGKINFPLFNPLLTSIIAIIVILKVLDVEYENYYLGGKILNSLIGPATVSLAIPLYKKFHILKKYYKSILGGVIIGNFVNLILIVILTKLLGYEKNIAISFMPKSITTAMAVGLSENLGGILPITVVLVIITGITGAIIGPEIFKLLNIKDDVAIGVSLGSASHAVGTSAAIEYSEEAGAIAGLSIIITGIVVIVLAPIILRYLI